MSTTLLLLVYCILVVVASLIGGALLHMLPAAAERMNSEHAHGWAAIGFASFFGLEQILHWHHGKEDSHGHHHHSHSLPASFCTTALHLPENMPVSQMKNMLARLPENVIRAKGFAYSEADGWQVLHKVYDSVDVTPLSGGAPNAGAVLICIGQHLNPQDVIQAVSDS